MQRTKTTQKLKKISITRTRDIKSKERKNEQAKNLVDGSPEYTEHIVCYADIIGFKERVLSLDVKEVPKEIEKIRFCFSKIVGQTEWEKSKYPLKINVFSDCFSIARKLNCLNPKNYIDDIFTFTYEILLIQGNFIAQGMLLRGGITIGNYYADDKIIYGSALIQAHELEQKEDAPIIIIDKLIIERSINRMLKLNKKNKKIMYPDGWKGFEYDLKNISDMEAKKGRNYYLDYIKSSNECDSLKQSEKLLRTHRKIIMKGLAHKNNHVKKKYIWLSNYHNRFINTLKNKYKNLLIPTKLFS